MLKGVHKADIGDWRRSGLEGFKPGQTVGGIRGVGDFDRYCRRQAELMAERLHQLQNTDDELKLQFKESSRWSGPIAEYFAVEALHAAYDFHDFRVVRLKAQLSLRRYSTAGIALAHLSLKGEDELIGVAGQQFDQLVLEVGGGYYQAQRQLYGTVPLVGNSARQIFPDTIPDDANVF